MEATYFNTYTAHHDDQGQYFSDGKEADIFLSRCASPQQLVA
jgi:hypothetical protein